jgi:hypothetical protein
LLRDRDRLIRGTNTDTALAPVLEQTVRIRTILKNVLSPSAPANDAEKRFWQALKSLGEFRWRVLSCVGDFDRNLPNQFDLSDPASFPESLRHYLESLRARWLPTATGPQFNSLAIVAAGY